MSFYWSRGRSASFSSSASVWNCNNLVKIRGLILLLFKKVKETQNIKYIPLLESREKVDYKKVRGEIRATIQALESSQPVNEEEIQQREDLLNETLLGYAPQDLILKCWDCGNRFTFSVGEQKFFKQKGLSHPKRCSKCRDKGFEENLLNSFL